MAPGRRWVLEFLHVDRRPKAEGQQEVGRRGDFAAFASALDEALALLSIRSLGEQEHRVRRCVQHGVGDVAVPPRDLLGAR